MKWILLLISLQRFLCDQNGPNLLQSMRYRGGRSLFGSKEDESGVHLHIWNDMGNKDNYYPNLMRHIVEESTSASSDESKHIHFNMNELMPTPQPQSSPVNLLKNALMHTLALDEFRKSDQNLYGSFYKLNADRYKQSPLNWNCHPSAVNYIPKAYNTNLNAKSTQDKTQASSSGFTSRPSLQDQMRGTRSFVNDYYTNLHKKKPKSVIEMVGYEIGGLPKYSGRLLANEPMPQEYRTFKMFEPVPRQIMLPPPTNRIPDFKPVPPRLKIIPVIDEYLNNPNADLSQPPWILIKPNEKVKPNYLMPVPTSPVKMIPFKVNEAITMAPIRKFIPKTELNHVEPTTQSYHQSLISSDIETLKNLHTTANQIYLPNIATKAPKYVGYLSNHQYSNHKDLINIQHQASSYDTINGQSTNNAPLNDAKSTTHTNDHLNEYAYANQMNQMNSIGADSLKPVSFDDSRSTFNTKQLSQQINNNIVNTTSKKFTHKETKSSTRKSPEKHANDVIKLNVTGFRNASDENRNSKSGSSENDLIKIESNVKNDDSLRLEAINNHPIDSVSADSIQLSQTYSRQTTNVPQYTTPSTSTRDQDSLLMQLANDVKKALLTSLGNDTNHNDNDYFGGTTTHDPFLIAVFDEHDRAMHGGDNLSEELHFAEIDNNRFANVNNTNNSIQRIDHGWAMDRKDSIRTNVNKRDEQNLHKNKIKTKSNSNTQINKTIKSNSTEVKDKLNDWKFSTNSTLVDEKYFKWFSKYAEENKKLGRTVISEHFKKVEIEPNISWVILPRKHSTGKN